MNCSPSMELPEPALLTLVYELLDAHDDTARMAGELCSDLAWSAHLEYLRTLQRRGREIIAASTRDRSRRAP
jgi:hypothetical protein